jgi:hypothetical protein
MNTQQNDWLTILSGFGSKTMDEIGFFPFLGVMGISLFSTILISLLYVRFYKSRSTGSLIYRAFPLLGTSITAIFITIQFSLPLSLGLLGALSIVRFRTPIKEPEEIGFIMLVVASALCCATFNFLFLSIILIIAVLGLLFLRYGRRFLEMRQNDGMLIVTVPVEQFQTKGSHIIDLIKETLGKGRMDSVAENGDETVLSYNFINQKDEMVFILQDSLRDICEQTKVDVYYNRNNSF